MPAVLTEKQRSLYSVLLNGVEIDPKYLTRLHEIRVVDYLTLPDLCTFTVGFDAAQSGSDKHPIDDHPFKIGTALEVRLGARAELAKATVFKGDIVTLEPQFMSGGAELTVRAFDRSHLLNRSRKVRTFQDMTASAIVSKVVNEGGLTPKVTATHTTFPFMQQDNETDLDFIWRLANRIGFEFVVDDKVAEFRPIGSTPPIELEWPRQVRDFRPRLTGIQQVEKVTVRSWDAASKRVTVGEAASPHQVAEIGASRSGTVSAFGSKSHMLIPTEPTADVGEAKDLAQAMLDRLANAYVGADGACPGNPKVRAGAMVKIRGVGTQFGGTYRVQSSNHVLQGGGAYNTEFSTTAIQTLTGAVAAGRPQDFSRQLVIGIVTNNDDPEKMGRVRVKYPALDDQQEGWWARVVVPHAGADRGMMMLPKKGDEVLVGFEHDDTTRPLVIGSLFNGVEKPPEGFLDKEGSLAIHSAKHVIVKSGAEMKFHSTGDLTLEVKGKAAMTYGQDLTADIKQNLKVAANMSIELKSGSQLTIKGGMISVQSNGPLEIKGNPVTIDGGPMVSIKGGMVNLG
jgi:phage protein D